MNVEQVKRDFRELREVRRLGDTSKENALLAKYSNAINALSQIDRAIVDEYLHGHPLWKIGKRVGYSERGVKYHIAKIFRLLANH